MRGKASMSMHAVLLMAAAWPRRGVASAVESRVCSSCAREHHAQHPNTTPPAHVATLPTHTSCDQPTTRLLTPTNTLTSHRKSCILLRGCHDNSHTETFPLYNRMQAHNRYKSLGAARPSTQQASRSDGHLRQPGHGHCRPGHVHIGRVSLPHPARG